MSETLISVLIPTYNEAQTIGELLERLSKALVHYEWEAIVIDDGSDDGTPAIVREAASKDRRITLLQRRERGKGSALRDGFAHASGRYIATIDADLQYFPEDIPRVLGLARKGAGIAVGKRVASDVGLRRFLSLVFAHIVGRVLLGLPVTDVQSGLKVIRRDVLESIQLSANEWDFDVELLYRAKGRWKIRETEVRFAPRKAGRTKVGVLGTMWNLGVAALRLRLGG